jgi:hypothetical protein
MNQSTSGRGIGPKQIEPRPPPPAPPRRRVRPEKYVVPSSSVQLALARLAASLHTNTCPRDLETHANAGRATPSLVPGCRETPGEPAGDSFRSSAGLVWLLSQ